MPAPQAGFTASWQVRNTKPRAVVRRRVGHQDHPARRVGAPAQAVDDLVQHFVQSLVQRFVQRFGRVAAAPGAGTRASRP